MATIAKVVKEQSGDGTTTTTTIKKTVTETTETGDTGSRYFDYRPGVQAKQIVVHRSMVPTGRQYSTQQSSSGSRYGGNYSSMINPNAYVSIASQGVVVVKETRDREKKDMQDLNERLANYIEKARFLEARNRKLEEDLKRLREKWDSDRNYGKDMFEKELKEARRLLEEANKEKFYVKVELDNAQLAQGELQNRYDIVWNELTEKKSVIETLIQEKADLIGELDLRRNRQDALDRDRERDKAQIKRLQEQLTTAKADLNNQTLLHIDAENRRQTLEEEIAFLRDLHEAEKKELQAFTYNDGSDIRKYWTSHMEYAIRDIQDTYDEKLETMREELEMNYNIRIQEFQTGATKVNMETSHIKEESKRLRDQLGPLREKLSEFESKIAHLNRELEILRREKEENERDLNKSNAELAQECALLRAKMDATLREIQTILDTKLGLELEIAAYRKLLEGEESRSGLRQIVNSSEGDESYLTIRQIEQTTGSGGGDSTIAKVTQITKGEMSAKTTYQKSAKGPVGIYETGNDGKYVALENSGRKDEPLGGWTLNRNIDGKDSATYKFKEGFVLKPAEKLKIWSPGKKPADAGASDLEADKDWGVGAHIITKLINPTGEDRASHIQKTNFST